MLSWLSPKLPWEPRGTSPSPAAPKPVRVPLSTTVPLCLYCTRSTEPADNTTAFVGTGACIWLAGWAGWAGWAADVADKVRSYSTSDFFGEIALISDDNTRTATVKVASGSATYLRLARPDIDDDLLHLIRTAATLDLGDLRFAGDMEAQLEESREECASKYSECTLCDAAAAAAAAAAA